MEQQKIHVIIGSDEPKSQFDLEQLQKNFNIQELVQIQDSEDEFDFYSRFANLVSEKNKMSFENLKCLGIMLSKNGTLCSIVMSKFKGITTTFCHSRYLASMGRKHNNGNVMVIGRDISTSQKYMQFIPDFIESEFECSNKLNHARRVQKIQSIQNNEFIEAQKDQEKI